MFPGNQFKIKHYQLYFLSVMKLDSVKNLFSSFNLSVKEKLQLVSREQMMKNPQSVILD